MAAVPSSCDASQVQMFDQMSPASAATNKGIGKLGKPSLSAKSVVFKGLPCATPGNYCIFGGICLANRQCGQLPPNCSGLQCFSVGNKCFLSSKHCKDFDCGSHLSSSVPASYATASSSGTTGSSVGTSSASPDLTNSDLSNLTWYKPLSAQQKQAIQWAKIQATKYDINNLPTEFPPPGSDPFTVLRDANYLRISFEWEGDEMPGNRNRLVFSPLAVICKIKFNTFQNTTSGYTGIFQSGGIGFIRLSINGVRASFDPTASMKIYVDGKISQNFNFIKDAVGQGSNKNYFLNSFSNNMERNPTDNQDTFRAFNETIDILNGGPLDRPSSGYSLGLYEQASIHSDGTPVTGPIVAPWDGRAVPHPDLKIDPATTKDNRWELNRLIKPGQVIYRYWGKRTPDQSAVAELIGEIVADSNCDASQYGDAKIFLRQAARQWSLV
ncbi:hypothetical protein BV898_10022 [Hypsibius exemplaris]|uniref:Uncharacterized protein n=1 Tax=Hypsibius exemplaris TaxID=2072580 RepID=A0A1W0WKN3_HYPEX|nr:hypothetical protein BV898_10022 [Hypsibius exemplaris]